MKAYLNSHGGVNFHSGTEEIPGLTYLSVDQARKAFFELNKQMGFAVHGAYDDKGNAVIEVPLGYATDEEKAAFDKAFPNFKAVTLPPILEDPYEAKRNAKAETLRKEQA